jgi:hypothetical protein
MSGIFVLFVVYALEFGTLTKLNATVVPETALPFADKLQLFFHPEPRQQVGRLVPAHDDRAIAARQSQSRDSAIVVNMPIVVKSVIFGLTNHRSICGDAEMMYSNYAIAPCSDFRDDNHRLHN